tara:strand:- start:15618 stop:16217 length:600 start_codon:yes stop_codon:yes gene_type:complete
MKKTILIILIFFNFFSFSQNFNGGVICGVSGTQVSGDYLGGFNKAGLFLGIFTEIPSTNYTNIKMEMNFVQKGSNNPEMGKNNIPDISTSYVEIPISFNYYQNESINIESGLQTAILLRSFESDLMGKIESDDILKFNKWDIGLFLGVNYIIYSNLILNSRISNSIIPIREHASGLTKWWNKGQYNSVLSFTLHYYLKT